MEKIEKVAIANRGEVAVRIIRACQELGIETVLLHSEADRETPAFRMADETVCIGPSSIGESYLSIENTVNGALSAGADAVHPGFGFLSENAEFAQACMDQRLVFIGPSAEAIRLFGDKVSAKNLVQKTGGPVIPGYQGDDQSMARLLQEATAIGFPVMVKAAAGGGGRGLKVIRAIGEAKAAIESAQREGQSAFGSSRVFLEKYLDRAKHIEIQIFGDCSGKMYHLFERECSVQRRHQKVIEEALSPSLNYKLRSAILQAAVDIAKAGKYVGAGTVEFLVQDDQFYFLEMNTRLQVEHPVTEMVLGVDLVKAQILTAQGKKLVWDQEELTPRGHAIECRIYAEDSFRNGMPSTGRLLGSHWPHGPGRRFEVGIEPGDSVTSFYDSMIAKIIVWDETRPRAIQKMRKTLQDTVIFGLHTNIPYLQAILSHQDFVTGVMNTNFLSDHFPQGLKAEPQSEEEQQILKKLFDASAGALASGGSTSAKRDPWTHPWGAL